MDADRTDPEIDSGPTCLDVVQTVEVGDTADVLLHPDCEYCYLYRCDECHAACEYRGVDSDDLGMDPDDGPEIDPAEYRSWHRFCVGEQKRGVNRQRTTKGHERRALRWMSRREKRLSAMRRSRGGGR